MNLEKNKYSLKIINEIAPYLNLGWQLIITILLFVVIGYFLDNWLKTAPILLIVFSLLGCAIALVNFIRFALKKEKK
ncbi:MAG: AtpZ/AtpI family protein [Ignavibacteria bacterium]|nr:AtpZ/AtpI family protein [Ignavibacteria bacterium]